MKFNKKTAVAAMAVLMVTPTIAVNAYAAGSAVKVQPAYSEFNDMYVNGSITVNLPEHTDADVKITFNDLDDSGDYYVGTYSSAKGSAYVFDIEGRNVNDNSNQQVIDERTYKLEFSVKDTESNLSSGKYTYEFSLMNPDYYPNSRTDYNYIIRTEQKNSDKDYDTNTTTKTENGVTKVETVVTFYLSNSYTLGDVNEDGAIDAMDASLVLIEYSNIATQKPGIFNENQRKAADVNKDGTIDALDASNILLYYSDVALGKVPTWR